MIAWAAVSCESLTSFYCATVRRLFLVSFQILVHSTRRNMGVDNVLPGNVKKDRLTRHGNRQRWVIGQDGTGIQIINPYNTGALLGIVFNFIVA